MALSVDPRRKHSLLLEARSDRLRWIQSIPLPYGTNVQPQQELQDSILSKSHAGKQLPTMVSVLNELYQDESEGGHRSWEKRVPDMVSE